MLIPVIFGLVLVAELGTLGIVAWVGGSSNLLDVRLLLVILVAATVVTGATIWLRRFEPSPRRPPKPLDRWHSSVVRPRVLRRSIPVGLVFAGLGVLLGIPLGGGAGGIPWWAYSELLAAYFGGYAAYLVAAYGDYVKVYREGARVRHWSQVRVLLRRDIASVEVVSDLEAGRAVPVVNLTSGETLRLALYWARLSRFKADPDATPAGRVATLLGKMISSSPQPDHLNSTHP